jgi:hypothetical protein
MWVIEQDKGGNNFVMKYELPRRLWDSFYFVYSLLIKSL